MPDCRLATEPRVGRVVRRFGGGGAKPSRNSVDTRSRASLRLRDWERWVDTSTVSTVPTSRGLSWVSSRSRCAEVSGISDTSTLSWTRESVVFTPCPPGPDDRENRSVTASLGTTSPRGTPGPDAKRMSFMLDYSRDGTSPTRMTNSSVSAFRWPNRRSARHGFLGEWANTGADVPGPLPFICPTYPCAARG